MAKDTGADGGVQETTQQAGPAGQPGGGDEPRTFTQEQVDRIVQERLARAKSTPPADYDDLKAKAARLDEIEESKKTELQRANDAAARAKAKADEWKARYERLQAEGERARQVAEYASQYQVDAGLLSRMEGDVEDNAKYLAGLEAARPKYPAITDDGRGGPTTMTRDEILQVSDTRERQRLIAENMNLFT